MSKLHNIKTIFIRVIKSPVVLLLLLEVILLGFLYKYGFRITYGPDLEASWDAISAIGQWAGVLVGFLIPIAAVYLQSKLDKSKEEIGESNTALLEEFESFKNEYEDKLKVFQVILMDKEILLSMVGNLNSIKRKNEVEKS